MNFRTVFPLVLALVAGACGAPRPLTDAGQPPIVDAGVILEDAGVSTDAGTMADAGPIDAGTVIVDSGKVDAGLPCDRNEPCTLSWAEPPHYPVPVDHHTSFVHEVAGVPYLYVVGGVRTVMGDVKDVYTEVRRAKVTATGLEPWTDVGVLPQPLAFAAQVINGNHIYLMAGLSKDMTGEFASAKLLVGVISPVDGTIVWSFGPSLSSAVLHGTAVVLDNKLYLMGGSAQQPKDDVLVSQLDANGVPGPWVALGKLPVPRSHHTAVVHDGHIFLIAGFTTGQLPLSPVWKSVHDTNGALIGWKVVGDMPTSPWTAGASVWGNTLLVVGGGEGGQGQEHFVDHVRQARFLDDGTLSGFADITALPVARSHVHQAPIYEGRVFSVGGRLWPSATSMDRAFIGTFQ